MPGACRACRAPPRSIGRSRPSHPPATSQWRRPASAEASSPTRPASGSGRRYVRQAERPATVPAYVSLVRSYARLLDQLLDLLEGPPERIVPAGERRRGGVLLVLGAPARPGCTERLLGRHRIRAGRVALHQGADETPADRLGIGGCHVIPELISGVGPLRPLRRIGEQFADFHFRFSFSAFSLVFFRSARSAADNWNPGFSPLAFRAAALAFACFFLACVVSWSRWRTMRSPTAAGRTTRIGLSPVRCRNSVKRGRALSSLPLMTSRSRTVWTM